MRPEICTFFLGVLSPPGVRDVHWGGRTQSKKNGNLVNVAAVSTCVSDSTHVPGIPGKLVREGLILNIVTDFSAITLVPGGFECAGNSS